MGKRGRHRRGGRVTPKGTQPPGRHRPAGRAAPPHGEPELITDVRRTLNAGHPLELLELVSSLLTTLDPRLHNPFEHPSPTAAAGRAHTADTPGMTVAELVDSLVDVKRTETSALLAVLVVMAPDELLRARARRALSARPHSLPRWLSRLASVEAYRTIEMIHVLGDGDDVIIGVRLADGREVSVLVYIDHNLGTLVKDAFAVPESLDQLLEFMDSKIDDEDTTVRDLDPADARVRVTEAIALDAMTIPRRETETWPACRPLVEWVVRLLPEGGRGYERPEWDQAELDAIAARFFASPFAAGLEDDDHSSLLDSLLWYGSGYGPGDPLRWSPVAVELVLVDWIPRKVVAPADRLAKVPALLRAFIRFSHHERGIRASLTTETLAAVDHWEPEYQQIIRSPRPQGSDALFATLGLVDPAGPWPRPGDESPRYREMMLDVLRRAVGGEEALDALDDRPLPDESFAWEVIPEDIHARVGEVLALVDRCCDELLDVECRTACRRFLARAAAGNPDVFRRRGRAATAAAAVCWVAGKANELFPYSRTGIMVKDLTAHFDLRQGGVSQRAEVLLRAGGFDPPRPGAIDLGSPEFLVSSHRRTIIDRRDYARSLHDG